jgi:hypothetical protein
MSNPFHTGRIGNVHRRFDDGNPRPPRPDQDLHLELESPGAHAEPHGLRQRVDAKSALGVGQGRSAGAPNPEIGEFPPEAARPGDIIPEHPLPSARINPGTSAGSCCPSASSVTAQSAFPAMAEKPVRMASPLPRFSSCRRTVTPPNRSRPAAVPSVEPSSTTQIGRSSQQARSITGPIPPA